MVVTARNAFYASAASLVVAAACYTAPPGGTGTIGASGGPVAASGCKSDIATIQSTVFVPKCATADCHTATKPASGLDLGSPGVEARLVGVPSTCPDRLLVEPGSATASVLIDKISNAKPICGGDRMPQGGALAEDDIACISQWIASLAPGSGDGGGLDSGPGITCAANETACGSACVDTKTDKQNCGSCGKVCTEPYCVDGACTNVCTKTECSGACVDTATDPNNCGACGTKCTGGKVCNASACTCGTNVVTLATIQSSIFSPDCTGGGCHSAVGPKQPAEGLDLSNATNAYNTLVGKPSSSCSGKTRVIAGDTANSYLMNKLTGVGMCNGSRMPKGAGLSAAEIDSVRNWICNGANK